MPLQVRESFTGELLVALAHAIAAQAAGKRDRNWVRDTYERDDWDIHEEQATERVRNLHLRRGELYYALARALPRRVDLPNYPSSPQEWDALMERIPQLLGLSEDDYC